MKCRKDEAYGMEKKSSSANKTLEERYPDISWMLHFTSYPKWELFKENNHWNAKSKQTLLYNQDDTKKAEQILQLLDVEHTEVVFLAGIGLGRFAEALIDWLDRYPDRSLVIFEEDLGVIDSFLKMPNAGTILSHSRIHLFFFPNIKIEEVASLLTSKFPSKKVQVFPGDDRSKDSRMNKLKFAFATANVHAYALFIENYFPYKLLPNLIKNFSRLSDSSLVNEWKGKFENIPAVICGAGPSLSKSLPELASYQNHALFLAGGTTITAISKKGIVPHFSMAIDPNFEEYIRLKNSTAFGSPFLYGHRLQPKVFDAFHPPLGYLVASTGGPLESWLEKKLGIDVPMIGTDLGKDAFSITTLATSLACFLGCSPIIFCGVDLAFTGNELYAKGALSEDAKAPSFKLSESRSENTVIQRKDRYGKRVYTLVKWLLEAKSLGSFSSKNPHLRFINCTEGGIPIPNISNSSLKEVLKGHPNQTDFSGWIHTLLQNSSICKEKEIQKILKELKASFQSCFQICEELTLEAKKSEKENAKSILLKLELEEEIAYKHFLYTIPHASDLWLNRIYSPKGNFQKQGVAWEICRNACEQALALF